MIVGHKGEMMNKNLEVGDVFNLTKGMKVYARIPQKFIYANITEKSKDANKLSKTDIVIGDKRKTTKNVFDSAKYIGEYVVINTAFTGGGTGMGRNDVYPDGHHVVAKKLNVKGEYTDKGMEISFYQSGCFTAMIEPETIKVVRKMKMGFK